MKRLMAAAAALSLMAGTAALADPPKHDGAPPSGGGHGGGAPHGGGHAAPAGGGNHGGGAPPPAPAGGGSGGPHAYVPQGRNDTPHPEGVAAPAAGRAVTHQGRAGFGAPGFTPGGDRPRYDAQHFPPQVRAHQRYDWRGGHPWQNQPGWYYRRWAFGMFLPAGWYVQDYWIEDYDDYDLPVPPYGYEWVRNGPDALLVDTYTGEVVEVVYGLF